MTAPVTRFAGPIRTWIHRAALVLVVSAAIGLAVLGRTGTPVLSDLRTAILDLTVPVMDALSRPVNTVADAVETADELAEMRAENAALRRENERLQRWEGVARELRAENEALRRMLNVPQPPETKFVTARVVADSGESFVRSVLVNAGKVDGVRVGQAAVAPGGLAGRIAEVGRTSARVLLITDINSRIPVVIQSTRARAILAGDNTDRPKLTYVADQAEVTAGQRVVTSGDGGVFPPGLRVGRVVEGAGEGVRVQPNVAWHRLEYLRVADHGLSGTLMDGAAPNPETAAAQGAPR